MVAYEGQPRVSYSHEYGIDPYQEGYPVFHPYNVEQASEQLDERMKGSLSCAKKEICVEIA
jgi:hypothetical protein